VGIIVARLWSGGLSHEKEHPMRGLSFTEIHSKNYFYDFPHFLCSGDSHFSLLDFGMVFLARISGLQPVFQNPQSQTTNLKFYFRE